MTVGAIRVAILSLVIVGITGGTTWYWWCDLSEGDTLTNTLRNVALIGGLFVAWVFALWRSSIASQQAAIAKQEGHHARFQMASEFLAKQGLQNIHTRISGLLQFRHLVHDVPDLGLQATDIVVAYMIHTPIDEHHHPDEFRLAQSTASFFCDTIDRTRMFNDEARKRLREEVKVATSILEGKMTDWSSNHPV